ncbi:rab3 GTPase-activating protein non-catalytic subunit isoform X2 [Condylostylus longicornis]|uniref:rab3 GTPase-activating protein non-catalytic subunit isoform X2 n=1 Tax=Condylostylus longicornis TaxID=2530218 RepID=UPI00244E0810|nr:rab3 GTPase-activating protein non-catalytic subunit isoform X2 [Condylostylus longicornis]
MSCEVKIFANIIGLKEVQELFGFSHDENWLKSVVYSVSPTLETIVFAHGCKLVFMTLQDSHLNYKLPRYIISYKGELENENEIITSIICLPISNSSNNRADWTCIAVGLSSGLVQFYIDSGIQIFSQRWHTENVLFLKAQSDGRFLDELHVGYLSCVCILQGVQLFNILKNMKQIVLISSKMNNLQIPETVPCRKWEYRLKAGGLINDAVVVGSQESCAFDHYLEQSLEKGFYAKCRSAPTQNSLVVGIGVKPYTGFFYAKEGYVTPDFGDVAKAVATKVISAIPSWIFKSSAAQNNSKRSNENELSNQPGEPMHCRFGICDIQREGINIWLAPGNEIAVVADNLHRVILIDLNRGVALRIWKGYRDAQCGFLRVKEKSLKNSDKSSKRRALFLIIYVPSMSCLEIWALQNGPRVAAFTISKNGQLSYNTHSLMAINSGVKSKINDCKCVFIDPSDETLKSFSIPFHCALSEGNSKTAKDIHLLRRLKVFLRADGNEDDVISEIEALCGNLQTDELRAQCLDILTKSKKLRAEVLLVAVKTLEKSCTTTDVENDSVENNNGNTLKRKRSVSISCKSMATLLKSYEQLAEFYLKIKSFHPHNDEESAKTNYSKLILNEVDLEVIQTLLDLGQKNKSNYSNNCKVKFEEMQGSGDFLEFLNIFLVDTPQVCLNPKKREFYGFIGADLFSKFLEQGQDLNCYIQSIQDTLIPNEDLLNLVLHYWLERPFNYLKCEEIIEDMARLGIAIQIICDKAEPVIKYEYNLISPWWQNVREVLLESPSAARGLLAAMVCRNISFAIQKNEKVYEGDYDEEGEELWEQVSQEAAQWTLLIGKLDDISILGAILSVPVISNERIMPTIPYTKPDCSLKAILCNGKGTVSELTAKWLANSGISPKHILETKEFKGDSNVAEKNHPENINEEELQSKETEKDLVITNLNILRQHFPFSLESGILLCHLSWEYMSYWSKNLPQLEYLEAGLKCLKTFKEEDFALKHGLCCMIWNAHLKIPLEATKKLIHKVGKLPKEKLCQQEIGMSMQNVTHFLDLCLEFLENFQKSLYHDKRELKFEEILQDDQIPLTFLALQKNHAILEILLLHIELCKVLHLISFFSLKVQKPMTFLFDPIANQTFFAEINQELNYSLTKADFVLQKQRDEFLCQAVSASMDLIREDLERLYILEHVEFMKRIEELAEMWDLDKSVIKKHQVVEIYAHGWDVYAEELLQDIADKESIGPLLLEIAGRRLNLFASDSSSIFCQVASIGPQLLNYLDNLVSVGRVYYFYD